MALRRGIAALDSCRYWICRRSCSSPASPLLYFVATRGPTVPEGSTLVVRPGGELLDVRPDDIVGQLVGRERDDAARPRREPPQGQARLAHHGGRAAAVDARARRSGPRCRNCATPSPTSGESGKPVIAYLEYGGDREYYLASAADQVFLLPTSPLDLTGIASYEIFLRGALDKIGAYPDFVQIGPYKTAANQLTQQGFTPAHREMLESLNRDLYEQLVQRHRRAARKKSVEAGTRAAGRRSVHALRRRAVAGLVDDSPTSTSSTTGSRS